MGSRWLCPVLSASLLVAAPWPSSFWEPNRGQAPSEFLYLARSTNGVAGATAGGPRWLLGGRAVTLALEGASARPEIVAAEPHPSNSSYFAGAGPDRWITRVPHFGRLTWRGVYPGIDLAMYGGGPDFEYDFVLAPGASPSAIGMRFEGADSVRIAADGSLVVTAGSATMVHQPPVAWQESNGARIPVKATLRKDAAGLVGFDVGTHDPVLGLVIDPAIVFSTFAGRDLDEEVAFVTTDPAGFVYVSGDSFIPFATGRVGFVMKFTPSGQELVWASYFGNGGSTSAVNMAGLAVDALGFVAGAGGATANAGVPIRNAFLPDAVVGAFDTWLFRLQPDGAGIVFSTWLRGSAAGAQVALGPGGDIFVAGGARRDFPTSPLAFRAANPNMENDAFVARFTPQGVRVYSTLVTGNTDGTRTGFDNPGQRVRGRLLAVDAAGRAYLAGTTQLSNLPVPTVAYDTTFNPGPPNTNSDEDIYVIALDPSGRAMVYATYFGGSSIERPTGLALDASGVYLVGITRSTDLPLRSPYQASPQGMFAAKLNPSLTSLEYSTYLGDAFGGYASVDSAGRLAFAGTACGPDFPLVNSSQPRKGPCDALLGVLSPNGSSLLYSGLFGGIGEDGAEAVATGPAGSFYIAGRAGSADFPVVNPQRPTPVRLDGFLAQVTLGDCGYVLNPETTQTLAALGETRNLTLKTDGGCGWAAASNAPWLSLTGLIGGSGDASIAYTTAPNNSGAVRTGRITVAGRTATIRQPSTTPEIGGVVPAGGASGSGLVNYTFSFSDSEGWQDLEVVNILVNDFLDGRNACYLAYHRPSNVLYLVNNAGSALLPGMVVGSGGSLVNNQCTVLGPGLAVTGSGSKLTLHVSILFTFPGNRIVYLAARDSAGRNSGWRPVGTVSLPSPPPSGPTVGALPATPASGRTTGPLQTYTFTFNHPAGWETLEVVNVLINRELNGDNACYVAYSRPAGLLYLVKDSGPAAGLSPGIVLGAPGAASNSQCTIHAASSSAAGQGNTLSLTIALEFAPTFRGDMIIYAASRTAGDAHTSGWQAIGSLGLP
ncbi:MAG: BACON domain-containing protein [Bryobacteraceae bacterium]